LSSAQLLAAVRPGLAARRITSTSTGAAICSRPAITSAAGTSEMVSATCAADPTGTARRRCRIAGRSACTPAAISTATGPSASAARRTGAIAR